MPRFGTFPLFILRLRLILGILWDHSKVVINRKQAAIARGLVPVIEAAGGSARAGTPVGEILLEDGKAVAVRTKNGASIA